jgi:hypothetical protein
LRVVLSIDAPIFESRERESLEANQYVQPYASITKHQLVGLLAALGEYQARVVIVEDAFTRRVPSDPELPEMCRVLASFRHRRRQTPSAALSGQWVFDAPERSALSKHKYVCGTEDLNKQELISLLEALGRYSLRAPIIEQVFGPFTGIVRALHAHNALVCFRDKPFTQGEFEASVRSVVRGEKSSLTASSPHRRIVTFGFKANEDAG